MLSQRELRQEAQAIIKGCPLIARHVSTGLDRRLCDEQWYENPLICHALIFGNDKWLTTLEISLQEADFENITNYDKIFGDLRGADDSYDEQLFDIFAEVQLARWARKAGYDKVEKILPPSHGKCPDFLLTSGQNVTLAEAKHCREDDFVLDFLCSRLQGLGVISCRLMTFGLNLHPTDDLASYKKVWTDKGSGWETKYKEWIRANLTSTTLETIERQLERTPGKSVPILDGKIIVCRKEGPRTVRKNYSFVLGIENILNEALKRIETKLIQGLTQIVDYNGNHCQGLSVNLGAIFLDGWTPDDVAYYELFKQMEEGAPYFSYVWEKIKHIKEIADSMCGDALAFKLIINPSITPGKFKPFEFPLGEWRASAELKVE